MEGLGTEILTQSLPAERTQGFRSQKETEGMEVQVRGPVFLHVQVPFLFLLEEQHLLGHLPMEVAST